MIAVPSVLLYALGVVVFWLRVANEYDRVSIGTTWYAASLVPRSTAAASGIEVMLRGFVYGTMASVVVLLIAHVVVYAKAKKRDQTDDVKFFSVSFRIPFLVFLAGLVSVVLNLQFSEGSSYGLLFTLRVIAATICILSLFAVYPFIVGTDDARVSFESLFRSYPKPVYRLIAVVLVFSVFASILLPREASLSCLWKEDPEGEVYEANAVNTQSDTEPLQWTLQGGFLSKSVGTWYVLTEADRLQAIPDDESTRVVGGDFSIEYLRVGNEGAPVEESVTEEDMEPGQTYVAVKRCSAFPSQPTIHNFGNTKVYESNYFVRAHP